MPVMLARQRPLKGALSEDMIRVFIGYDGREEIAFHVLARSIWERASEPVSITPVRLSHLEGFWKRPRHPLQSTDFSFSRFLVPYLCDYQGFAIFMDCDMLCLKDIADLWSYRDTNFALKVVKHKHDVETGVKFLNQPQTPYQRKNWSSVMLFNNDKCRNLTPEYVCKAEGLDLHQFKWLKDEDIGDLPENWNYLVKPTRASLR